MKNSIIKEKSFSLSLRVVKLYQYLTENKREHIMSKQLLRAGTSVGANIREATRAESDKDFMHKLAVAQKEADETGYWLELLKASGYLNEHEFNSIYPEVEEVIKILAKIIITKKQKHNNPII